MISRGIALFLIAQICFTGLFAQSEAGISINWSSSKGTISEMHWGYNDFAAKTQYTFDKPYVDFERKVNPGIVRVHQAGLVGEWTKASSSNWDTAKIKLCLDNATHGYPNAKVLLCFSDWPAFISTQTGYLPIAKEQALEDYFAKLPAIMKSIGHHIDYYEFINENDQDYAGSIGINEYANLIKRLSVRLKAEVAKLSLDYIVKVGGGAFRWPNPDWYKPIIDIAGKDMDFISWHSYAVGTIANGVSEEQRNTDIFKDIDWYGKSAVTDIRAYAQSKGCGQLQLFLDELNVQYIWTPYEPRTHNNVGAVWFASVIKRLAESNIDGVMMWNGKDGAYGLLRGDNSVSAPASLYIWSNGYLRGTMESTTSTVANVEALAVKLADGSHSILIYNKSANSYKVGDIAAITGDNISNIKSLCIDATVKNGDNWIPKAIDISDDTIRMTPWSVVLITNKADKQITPVEVSPSAILDNAIKISWKNTNSSISGFNILLNNVIVGFTTDTSYNIQKLTASTNYSIGVSVVDDVWNQRDTTVIIANTLSAPLLIDDQTKGNVKNQWLYSGAWNYIADPSSYNGDLSASIQAGNTAALSFYGNKISLFGIRSNDGGTAKVYIDDVFKELINLNSSSPENTLIWLSGDLSELDHTLKLEVISGKVSLDYAGVYSNIYIGDHQAPEVLVSANENATFKSIALTWDAPSDNTGIQGYYIWKNDIAIDTVYSPYYNLMNLASNTSYKISIAAFDVMNNTSATTAFEYSTQALVFNPVLFTIKPPVIDGTPDAIWARIPGYNLNPLNISKSGNKGNVRFLWDKNYLYVLLVTKDTSAVGSAGSVDVFYDALNTKAGAYGYDDYWFNFNKLTGFVSEQYHNGSANVKFGTTDTGYVCEAAFKWSVIHSTNIKPLYTFGLDVHVNFGEVIAPENQIFSWQPKSLDAGVNTSVLANLQLVEDTAFLGFGNPVYHQLLVYPNPVSSTLIIKTPSDFSISNISVISVTGVIYNILELYPYAGYLSLDVSNLPAGMYNLCILSGNIQYNQKFIKQ